MLIKNELKTLKEKINLFFNVDIDVPFRGIHAIYARSTYYKLCKTLDRTLTITEIGKSIGKDHSTVIHNLQKFDDRYNYDRNYQLLHDGFLSKYPEYINSFNYTKAYKEMKKLIVDTTTFMVELNNEQREQFIKDVENLKTMYIIATKDDEGVL